MLRALSVSTLAVLLTACGGPAPGAPIPQAEAASKKMATDFTLKGVDGQTYTLSEQRGKTVVLEWYNPGCPFVKHAHGEENGSLRTLGDAWEDKGIVWWAINSGSHGKQGFGLEVNKASQGEFGFDYPVLLDEDGTVGRAYGAKTTPHMFVIDAEGQIVYEGAIDNAPLGDSGGREVVNYVDAALTSLAGGVKVPTPATKPYGCSVKY